MEWSTVNDLVHTRNKESTFLGKATEPSLDDSDYEPLEKLLKVMDDKRNDNPHLKKLGTEIKTKIDLGW